MEHTTSRGALRMAALVAVLVAGCLASREQGGSDVDALYELDLEVSRLECECDNAFFMVQETCAPNVLAIEARDCVVGVINRHRDEFEPLIECTLRELDRQLDCLSSAVCTDEASWSACEAIDEDCDDSVAERYEDELGPCVRQALEDADGTTTNTVTTTNPVPAMAFQPAGAPSTCGNGVLDPGEPCDVVGGAPAFDESFGTCAAATMGAFPSGALGCGVPNCLIDISMCSP